MSTKIVQSIIDDITDAGCLYFLITGGEPLLRNDFPKIYRHAKENGLIITIFTNGTLINEKTLDLFREYPPHEIEISIYGATSSTYEEITRVPGSFNKCLQGIQKLVDNSMHLRLKTILMNINKHEFLDMKRIANDFGVKFRFDPAIFPRFNGDKTPLNLRVSPKEAVEKEFSDEENVSQWKRFYRRMRGQNNSDMMYHCGAGRTNFHLDPYGNISPCLMTKNIIYNIMNTTFINSWEKCISIINSMKASGDIIGCNKCEKIPLCGYCPAFFAMENGKEDIRSEYICSIGSERFQRINEHSHRGIKNGN
jgi:radical SAM protein with 4Fe4S-binding SPASM domain